MNDYTITVTTVVEVSVDSGGLLEEFPDVYEEIREEGGSMKDFISRLCDYEGIDHLINSEWCLGSEEFSPTIDVEKEE